MLKIRKFLSVLVAFVVFGVSFRGLSVNVEAATQHQPCTVTINTPGSYTITGGSNTYTADAGDDVIFDFTIINNSTDDYTVAGTIPISKTGGQASVSGQITYNGTSTRTSSMRLSNTNNPIDLEYTVNWTAAPTPPSGGGDSSSDTSSKTSTPVSHT
ncbi:MAG: hypothetical protein J6O61_04090, partial [Butyrivibrio sp.]|uniref:hypothetical protein n=1 Tax=Butyrivibrio sp. TaxID=28121 RepID=UPI001B04F468